MNLNLFSSDSDESNFKFGGEMVSGSGMRAVAACAALREPGADYDLQDPYELRSAIADLSSDGKKRTAASSAPRTSPATTTTCCCTPPTATTGRRWR